METLQLNGLKDKYFFPDSQGFFLILKHFPQFSVLNLLVVFANLDASNFTKFLEFSSCLNLA